MIVGCRNFIEIAQCEVNMDAALTIATEYEVIGYDAQYVALAKSLNAPLVTEDRKLRQAALGITVFMQEFVG